MIIEIPDKLIDSIAGALSDRVSQKVKARLLPEISDLLDKNTPKFTNALLYFDLSDESELGTTKITTDCCSSDLNSLGENSSPLDKLIYYVSRITYKSPHDFLNLLGQKKDISIKEMYSLNNLTFPCRLGLYAAFEKPRAINDIIIDHVLVPEHHITSVDSNIRGKSLMINAKTVFINPAFFNYVLQQKKLDLCVYQYGNNIIDKYKIDASKILASFCEN